MYTISISSITPAFNVTHSTEKNYCSYDAIPARSFVIDSQLTTIKGHTAVTTGMDGSVGSMIDLDNGFNYSVCDYDWINDTSLYYDSDTSYSYRDED